MLPPWTFAANSPPCPRTTRRRARASFPTSWRTCAASQRFRRRRWRLVSRWRSASATESKVSLQRPLPPPSPPASARPPVVRRALAGGGDAIAGPSGSGQQQRCCRGPSERGRQHKRDSQRVRGALPSNNSASGRKPRSRRPCPRHRITTTRCAPTGLQWDWAVPAV